jgi:hypothetical protein
MNIVSTRRRPSALCRTCTDPEGVCAASMAGRSARRHAHACMDATDTVCHLYASEQAVTILSVLEGCMLVRSTHALRRTYNSQPLRHVCQLCVFRLDVTVTDNVESLPVQCIAAL